MLWSRQFFLACSLVGWGSPRSSVLKTLGSSCRALINMIINYFHSISSAARTSQKMINQAGHTGLNHFSYWPTRSPTWWWWWCWWWPSAPAANWGLCARNWSGAVGAGRGNAGQATPGQQVFNIFFPTLEFTIRIAASMVKLTSQPYRTEFLLLCNVFYPPPL